jgi:hypothetical protein
MSRLIAVSLFTLFLVSGTLAQTGAGRRQNPQIAAYFARLASERATHPGSTTADHKRRGGTPLDAMEDRLQKVHILGGAHPAATANDQLTINLPQFAVAPQFPSTGSDLYNIFATAEGDFNKDGVADVATLNEDGGLNIFLNSGNGVMKLSYSDTTSLAGTLTHNTLQLASADLNGDGCDDLAAMDVWTNQVHVWLSKCDGTFAAPVSYNVTPTSGASFFYGGGGIALADVTGDGHPDIVAVSADYENGAPQTIVSLQVFPGNGDGTFGKPIESDTTLSDIYYMMYGATLELADIDGDGVLDAVILVDDGGLNSTQGLGVMTAKGNNAGGFAALSGYSGAFIPGYANNFTATSGMAVADFNKDGAADVIFDNGAGTLYLALNQGGGSFAPKKQAIPLTTDRIAFRVGDLNGDGTPDIVTFGDGVVSTYLGKGDGSFATYKPHFYAAGTGPGHQQPALANYTNADNHALGVVYISQEMATGYVLLGNGDGSLQGIPILSAPSEDPSNLIPFASGDLNGDGIPDFLAFDYSGVNNSDNLNGMPAIVSLISDGKGGLQKKVPAVPYSYFNSIGATTITVEPMATDLNGDGVADMLLSVGNDIEMAVGNGDGSFKTPTKLSLGRKFSSLDCPPGLASAGKGSDGVLEFVVAYGGDDACSNSGSQASGVFAFTNGGANVSFTALGSSLVDAQLMDLDGDGILDLVTNDADGVNETYAVYDTHGAGDATFDPNQTNVVLTGYWVTTMLKGDYNQDGKADLTLTTMGTIDDQGDLTETAGGVLLLPGNNDGSFGNPTLADGGVPVEAAAWGDFNGDGHPDLAVSQFLGWFDNLYFNQWRMFYTFGVLPNAGDGTFPVSETYGSLSKAAIFTGDYNGDGSIDAALGPFANGVSLFLNQTPAPNFSLSASPASLTLAQGATGVATVTVTGTSTFAGTVSFTCAGAPSEASCSVNPSALTLGNGQSASVSVVVATTAPNNVYSARSDSPLRRWTELAGGAQLAGIFLLLLPGHRRVRRVLMPFLALTAVLWIGMLSGCSGSSTKPPAYTGTPTGQMTLTITATSGKLTQSFTLPVTVTAASTTTTTTP